MPNFEFNISAAHDEAIKMNKDFDDGKNQEQEIIQAINKRIEDLLKQGMPLRSMAELLGMNASAFLQTSGRETESRSSVEIFNVKEFVNQAVSEIKSKKITLPEDYIFHDQTITPPDAGELNVGNGEGKFEKPDIIPRTTYLTELLSQLEYPYKIHEGKNTPQMMRELSYKGFEIIIKESNKTKLALVCNEEGNATFIIHEISGIADIEKYLNLTKEQLNSEENVSRIEYRFENSEEYKLAVLNKLVNGEELKLRREKRSEVEGLKSKNEMWNEKFSRLLEYFEKNGDCNVPGRYTEDLKLGRWINTQRQFFKKKENQEKYSERFKKLNDIGFSWSAIEYEIENWDDVFSRLLEYFEEHGDCNVPGRYTEDLKLGRWIDTQRQKYKNGKLDQSQIRKLNDIGFSWSELEMEKWDDVFARLLKYFEKNGNCNVPVIYTEDQKLGKWVSHQRTAYKNGKLPENKIKRLNDIGFSWNLKEEKK